MTRPDHAIDAYLEGTLTNEQARAIDQWIAADPANAAAFLHLVRTHQTLGLIGKENKLAREASAIKPESIDHATLASLAEMEANAQPIPYSAIDQPFSFETESKAEQKSDITLTQALDDLRWAAGKAATKLIRSPYGITGTIAAILILGLYLFVPFGSSDPAPPQDIADNTSPDKPAESAPPILRDTPVATLTNTHNATWAEGASAPGSLAPGSKLHPNTRLTLTAGFAEITTEDGAVVILEAPASVELLDQNNAIRLHTGKLVGICETDSSKGFVVRTPHADITDLGTRFGVAIDHAGKTLAEVFQGSIQIGARSISGTGIHSRRLFAGDVAVLDQSGELNDQHRLGDAVFARLIKQAARSLQGIDSMSGQVEAIERAQVLKQGRYEPLGMANAWVCEELPEHVLTQDTPVTARLPNRYTARPTGPVAPIPLGTRIRSYIIGLDPLATGDTSVTQPNAAHGSVTFDGKILGVIATGADWQSFSQSFAAEAAADLFPSTIGTIEYSGDWFAIKKDQRTIEFDFSVTNNSDLIRVLVLEAQQTE